MTEAEVKIAELEALWRRLSEERLLLQGKVERADAGRAVLLRALQQAEKALEIEEVDLALRTIRSALYDE